MGIYHKQQKHSNDKDKAENSTKQTIKNRHKIKQDELKSLRLLVLLY